MATLLEDYMRDDPVANALRSCAPPPPPLLPITSRNGNVEVQPLTRSFSEVFTRHIRAPFTAVEKHEDTYAIDKRASITEEDWRLACEERSVDSAYGLGINESAWRRMRPRESSHQRSSSDSCLRKRQHTASSDTNLWLDQSDKYLEDHKRSVSSSSTLSSAADTSDYGARTPTSTYPMGLSDISDIMTTSFVSTLVTSEGDQIPTASHHTRRQKSRSPPLTSRYLPESYLDEKDYQGNGQKKRDSSVWTGPVNFGNLEDHIPDSQSANTLALGLAARLMRLVKDNVVVINPSSRDLEEGNPSSPWI